MSLVTDEGIDHILNTEFNSGTPVAQGDWFLGLINASPSPDPDASDTLASHAGWVETDDYAGDRKAWTNGAASGKTMTNASTVDFVMDDTLDVWGFFMCAAETGTTGPLFAVVQFTGGTEPVTPGDTLELTVTITGASG